MFKINLFRLNTFFLYLFVLSIVFEYWSFLNIQGSLSSARLIGIMYVLTSLPFIQKRISISRFRNIFLALVLFFFFYSLSSLFNSEYIDSINSVISFAIAQNLIMFVLLVNHLSIDTRLLKNGLVAFFLGVLLLGILYLLGIGYEVRLDGYAVRISLFGENPNSFANKAVLGFIIAVYIIVSKEKFTLVLRIFAIVGIPVLFSMILGSGSRSAFIILFIASVMFVLLMKVQVKYKIMIILVTFPFVLYTVVSVLSTESIMQKRMSRTLEENDFGSRDILAKSAFEGFKDNPILGVSRNPLSKYGKYRDPHNVYLAVLLAGGLLAFIPFIYFNGSIIIFALVLNKKGHFFTLIFLTVLNLIMIKSGGFISSKILWFGYAIVVTTYLLKFKLINESITNENTIHNRSISI